MTPLLPRLTIQPGETRLSAGYNSCSHSHYSREWAIPRLALLLLALTLLGLLAMAACSNPQPPAIGAPGQVSLVFFYTEA